MLKTLLRGHRELRAEAESLARAVLVRVREDQVADAVARAVLDAEWEQFVTRPGRKPLGYVGPNEAAWEGLGTLLDPFLADLKRCVAAGLEEAAVATCSGIVMGLYEVRDRGDDGVLAYAPGFPDEMARHAVATLTRESARCHGRRWTVSDAALASVPE